MAPHQSPKKTGGKTMSTKTANQLACIENPLRGIRNPYLRRLARRCLIERISKRVYPTVRREIYSHLKKVLTHALNLMAHRKRKTIVPKDVKKALRLIDNPLLDGTESDLVADVKPIKRSRPKKHPQKEDGETEKKKAVEKEAVAVVPKEKEKKKPSTETTTKKAVATETKSKTIPIEKTAAFKAAVAEAAAGGDVADPIEDI
jgi:histone H3/H4